MHKVTRWGMPACDKIFHRCSSNALDAYEWLHKRRFAQHPVILSKIARQANSRSAQPATAKVAVAVAAAERNARRPCSSKRPLPERHRHTLATAHL